MARFHTSSHKAELESNRRTPVLRLLVQLELRPTKASKLLVYWSRWNSLGRLKTIIGVPHTSCWLVLIKPQQRRTTTEENHMVQARRSRCQIRAEMAASSLEACIASAKSTCVSQLIRCEEALSWRTTTALMLGVEARNNQRCEPRRDENE